MSHNEIRWTRREFLIRSGAAGVSLALTPGMIRASETKEAAEALVGVDGMPLVKLGKTGEKVSIIGFGGSTTVAKSPILLHKAIQFGVNYIDTAESYDNGNSEREVGKLLAKLGNRKEMFIVTKTGDHNAAKLEEHLNGSLERLQTDRVDVLYLHNLGDPGKLDTEMMAAAEALKKREKIRYFGFSCHHKNLIPTLEKAAESGFVDVLMLKYNFRDYDNDALQAALDKCSKAEIGLIAMKTGAGAVPKFDEFDREGLTRQVVSLKATWADPRIHVVVSSMKSLDQVEENTKAAKAQQMSQKEWDLMERYAEATDHLYCRGCGQVCEPGGGDTVAVADILRYKMYYEGYGDRRLARQLFAELPVQVRSITGMDFSASEAACPYNLPIGRLMAEAERVLA